MVQRGGVIRRLTVEPTIPRQMFLRGGGGGDGVADADEEVERVCEGFSPDSLMVFVEKEKWSGCAAVSAFLFPLSSSLLASE